MSSQWKHSFCDCCAEGCGQCKEILTEFVSYDINWLKLLGLCIVCVPCFNISYIATGLGKINGCPFSTSLCAGQFCHIFGRVNIFGLQIAEGADYLTKWNDWFNYFNMNIQISDCNVWNFYYKMGLPTMSKPAMAAASYACYIGGYLCHTIPICMLRKEARKKYRIKVK